MKIRIYPELNFYKYLYILVTARSEPFIIGGRTVSPSNKWPGIAAIVDRGMLHCMGALINPYYVVTVAHGTASAYVLPNNILTSCTNT